MNNTLFMILISGMMFATLMGFIRLIKGPSAPDRVVAIDGITTIVTALMVLLALFMKKAIFLDVALAYAVIGFIGVLALAKFFMGDK